MKLLKKTSDNANAIRIAAMLESAEYDLIRTVTKTDGLTLKAQGDLVAMQRKLRAMRYEIEAEAGIA